MTPERLAELRSGPDGKDWLDVRLFCVVFEDGSALNFTSKSAPKLPKEFALASDETVSPLVWSSCAPLHVALRMDRVLAIIELEVPQEERRWTWVAND